MNISYWLVMSHVCGTESFLQWFHRWWVGDTKPIN